MKKYLRGSLLFIFLLCSPAMYAQKGKTSGDVLLKQIKYEMDVKKNYSQALTLSRSAVEQYPADIDFRFLLGRAYLLNNDLNNAQRAIDDVIKRSPGYKDAYIAGANIQIAKRNAAEAMRYVNRGLAKYNRDRDLRMKKMSLFAMYNNYEEAGKQADTLLAAHQSDPLVIRAFIDYKNEAALHYQKAGNIVMAIREYNRVLEIDPRNQVAIQGNLTAQMQVGDGQNSLNVINRVLVGQPDSYEFLMKKIAVLQEMKRYPEAIETLQKVVRLNPSDSKARQLDVELKLEAARYYKSTDPYFQYQSVLDKAPGNREALDNVINIAISRGLYDDALYWINKALNGRVEKDLSGKKISILQRQEKYGAAAAVAEQLYRTSRDPESRGNYIELELLVARDFAGQQLFDSAIAAYSKVLSVDPRNEQALNGSINILSGQKNYTTALSLIDKAIGYFPEDKSLLLKKAAILQENEQYDEATILLEQLKVSSNSDARIDNAIVDNSLTSARQMMQAMDYDGAAGAFARVLEIRPDNKEALNSIINIELARGGVGNTTALEWSERALLAYPEDRELLLKKSEALFRLKRYEQAYNITDMLRRKYPYNLKVRDNYREQLLLAATASVRNNDTAGALLLYKKVLEVNPSDTIALLGLANIYIGRSEFDSALAVTGVALQAYPDNISFLVKRASVLEQQKKFEDASLAADSVAHLLPGNRQYEDYAAYLRGKTYKNQLGIAYLNSSIDSTQSANIATLQYTRFGKKMSLTGRLNFAGRTTGTGLQLELESYINHSPKWYSYLNVAGANNLVFPKYKAAYSLFHNFSGSWEAELGGRWLYFDSLSAISGVGSVAKYLGDFWLNIRGYIIFVSDKQYAAATLTARQYLNNKTDFFFATLGYGNSPDEFSRSFQLETTVKYRTYSIGAGYQKMFNYRNIVSISGAWYNQRIAESRYRNQYDIYLSFFRRF